MAFDTTGNEFTAKSSDVLAAEEEALAASALALSL